MLLCPSSLTCLQCYDKENRLVSNPCLKSSTHLRIKSDIPACHTSSSALQFPLAPSLPTRVPVSDQTIFTSNTSPCSHLAQCLCICHHPSSLARDKPCWKGPCDPSQSSEGSFQVSPSGVHFICVAIPCGLVFLPHETKDRLCQAYSRCSTHDS